MAEWDDTEVAEGEEDSHLWAFVGDAWSLQLVNKSGKAVVSTSGDAMLGNAADATDFFVTTSKATDAGFCMKYPGANSYLNGQNGYVKSWSDNDPGSTFLVQVYVAPEDPNSVESVEAEALKSAPVYDLAGRRVEKPKKGIYIINAKKVVVK